MERHRIDPLFRSNAGQCNWVVQPTNHLSACPQTSDAPPTANNPPPGAAKDFTPAASGKSSTSARCWGMGYEPQDAAPALIGDEGEDA